MSSNRPGPGGGVRFIQPSDMDVETSTIKSIEPVEKGPAKKQPRPPKVSTATVKPPKPPKPPFESTLEDWVMAAKPAVKFSFAYAYWWLYTRLGLMRFKSVPVPSKTVNGRAEFRQNVKFLNDNRKYLNAIIVVLAAKGGSAKTTIIQWLAAFIGYYVKNQPALLGMDVGADKTVSRFNADESKLFNVTYLLELVKMGIPFSAKWLQTQTETDEESGVVMFKAKPEWSGVRDFQTGETIAMMRYMHELYPLLFGDTGPGLNMKASDGAAQSADLVLACNKGISKEALSDIRATLALSNYRIDEKKVKPLVVISGVLRRALNTRTQYEIAKELSVDPENVILLPYDRYLDDQKRFNLKRVHIPALSFKTSLMVSRFAKRVVEVLASGAPSQIHSAEVAIERLIVAHKNQGTEND